MKNLILCLLVFLSACSVEKKQNLQVFDLAANLKTSVDSTRTWNDFANSFQIYPLETKDDVLLANFFNIQDVVDGQVIGLNRVMGKMPGGWFISSGMKVDIQIFDTHGKHIRTIDRKGNGPQEYNDLITLLVQPDSFHIKVIDGVNMLTYDRNGNFLSRDSMPKFFFQAAYLGEGKFLAENPTYPLQDNRFQLSVIDGHGAIEKSLFKLIPDSAQLKAMTFFAVGNMVSVTGGVLFKNAYSDTVFQITPADPVKPWAVVNCGEYARSLNMNMRNMDVAKITELTNKQISIAKIIPFGDKTFIKYGFGGKSYVEIWEKGNQKPVVRRISDYDNEGLALLLDDGTSVNVVPHLIKDKKAYFIVDAYKVMDRIEGLKEDSNPVMIIADLK